MAAAFFVGVDGGGTRCRVRVRDEAGRLRAEREAGAANVYLAFDTAVATIREAVAAALAQAGAGPRDGVGLGLGLAGISDAAVATRVGRALDDLGTVVVTNDGDVACLGAHGGADGGLIIAGTGSGAVARVGGLSTAIGGRGFIMGDDGSGARLGLEALRRALRAHDGLEPVTPLAARLMARHGHDPVAVIEWARGARSADFGALAPLVFAAADEGDPLAVDLVGAAAAAVAALGEALGRLGADRLSLVGGLAGPLRPHLPPALVKRLHPVLFDAQDGALLLAGCPLAPPAPAVTSP